MINYVLIVVALAGCAEVGEYNMAIVCRSDACGTAFAMGENEWMTALHVLDGDRAELYVDGDWIRGTVVREYDSKDIVVLRTKRTTEAYLDLCEPPILGEHVCGCGYEGETAVCECGTVLAKNSHMVDWVAGHSMRISVAANHGWSGGPVLDRNGCAVGVIVGGKNSWSYSYAVGVPDDEL